MSSPTKIVLALDGMSKVDAILIARSLRDEVWGFKVNDLLIQEGCNIVSELKSYGKVFADAKFHDIPNTVYNSIRRLERAGADLITVHSSGGRDMMAAAVDASKDAQILAVTLLTSISQDLCSEMYHCTTDSYVLARSREAASVGAFGVVCSPQELKLLSDQPELKSLHKVTPGIRPSWYKVADDQSRILTPGEAVRGGASLIVVGRPITKHKDPKEAAQMINEELKT